jgi:hypothetical protein
VAAATRLRPAAANSAGQDARHYVFSKIYRQANGVSATAPRHKLGTIFLKTPEGVDSTKLGKSRLNSGEKTGSGGSPFLTGRYGRINHVWSLTKSPANDLYHVWSKFRE